MQNTTIKPKGKFFIQEPEVDNIKTILDSIALRMSSAEGKIEKKSLRNISACLIKNLNNNPRGYVSTLIAY